VLGLSEEGYSKLPLVHISLDSNDFLGIFKELYSIIRYSTLQFVRVQKSWDSISYSRWLGKVT
jgi:hypothetical protein